MTPGVIDDRGRVFGRFNLVDAAIAVAVLVLIPLAYGAFLLFRTPKPIITSVEMAPLTYIEERAAAGSHLDGKLKVHGRNLRPVLRAFIDGQAAIAYIFENPTSADVLFGNVPAGTHDLILYDGVQEVARAKAAVKVEAPPSGAEARVRVVGTALDLSEADARALRVGQQFPPTGEPASVVVALGDPAPDMRPVHQGRGRIEVRALDRWQRAIAVEMRCEVTNIEDCRSGGNSVAAAQLVMQVPGAPPSLRMFVEELVPAAAPHQARVRVRFVGPATLGGTVKIGDLDWTSPVVDGRAAQIVSTSPIQVVAGESTVTMAPEGTSEAIAVRASDHVAIFDADLTLGADPGRGGWRYRAMLLKVGAPLSFTTDRYVMRGTILSVSVAP